MTTKKTGAKPAPKQRCTRQNSLPNHPLLHPLLRKHAVHGKSNKAQRQRDRVNLKKEWPDENSLAL